MAWSNKLHSTLLATKMMHPRNKYISAIPPSVSAIETTTTTDSEPTYLMSLRRPSVVRPVESISPIAPDSEPTLLPTNFMTMRHPSFQSNGYNKSRSLPLPYQASFGLKPSYNSVVPLKVFQTWRTKQLPPLMYQNCQQLMETNPEFEFYLFDDADCYTFIRNHFNSDVLSAFQRLLPGAYKADLWRYCVLYIHGGIYMDIKYKCVNGFKLIALTEKEHFVLDRPYIDGVYNGLMVCKPRNSKLLRCIYNIIHHVNTRYYGASPLFPTGPCLFARFFSAQEKSTMDMSFCEPVPEYLAIRYHSHIVLDWYNGYRAEQTKSSGMHYSEMWSRGMVYAT